ncbi:MAG: histidinol phosphate phosphatase [Sphingomonas bacterium]|nr:histidinol phosphate phosphatase [Sphingomonas bacterium]
MDHAFFEQLSQLARQAIADALAAGLTAESKDPAGFDPVTEADRAAERAMRSAIEQHFPDHGIWGEEYGMVRPDARFRWSLDPVDGTRALVCGLASWAVLVGLLDQGAHVAGMIDLPTLDDRLISVDRRTSRNGSPVAASACHSIADARWSTTDPFLFDRVEAEAVARVRGAAKVARYGLDAMAYARVATGDLDLVIESKLQPHDIDALVAVVRGAGGHFGDWERGSDFTRGRVIAASTKQLYEETVALLAG